jgi:hypothetical protein
MTVFDKTAYEKQRDMQVETYGIIPWMLEGEARKAYVNNMTLALIAELVESLGEIPWKSWSSKDEFFPKAYLGEIIDAGHFLMNLALIVTPYAEDVLEAYMHKADVNIVRQTEGYDESNKCEHCGRALDEPHA